MILLWNMGITYLLFSVLKLYAKSKILGAANIEFETTLTNIPLGLLKKHLALQ